MKPISNKEKWLNEQTKEQLIIFYKNQEYEMERLRDKIELLTGSSCLGDCDGTNGSCIYCHYDNPEINKRCELFQSAFHQYRKEKRLKKEE